MRRLLLLALLAVTVAGCGQAAAPATPTVVPEIRPQDVMTAFRDTGLRAYSLPPDRAYNSIKAPGLVAYEVFAINQIGGVSHVVALYDTPAHAEAARAASTNTFTGGFRRDRLVLVWAYGDSYDPYFTIFQVTGR